MARGRDGCGRGKPSDRSELCECQHEPKQALKKGGIFRYGLVGASTQVDPQLAYVTTAWSLEYATAAKLYNYPDKKGPAGSKLIPEVASKFTVSKNGKVYTFTIRPGFVFSDGSKVTAKNFKYAIERTANHDLASPGAPFITDPTGTNIVGAKAVNDGTTTNVSGVIAKGNKLIVKLTKADGTFMAKITMPFFQATSTKIPLTKEVVNVNKTNMPSAGPYYMTRNDPDRLTQLRLNPHYKSGPGRTRPHNLAGVDVSWNLNEQTAFNQTHREPARRERSAGRRGAGCSPASTGSTRPASGRSPSTAPATCR